MTRQQRIEVVAMKIADLRDARFPSDFTQADHDEAEKFVELYDTLRELDVPIAREGAALPDDELTP